MPSAPTQQMPLATLLSQALVAFTIEFDNLAEERITAAGARPWIASQAVAEGAGDRLRGALEAVLGSPAFADGMRPPASGWRARPPYLAQAERLLADPRGALPRHPLVLHRGGFPDGA